MKTVGMTLLTLSLLISPSQAAQYQGKTIDGQRLSAKVYSYETGGVYEAQVRFEGDQAMIEFSSGERLTLKLNQSVIRDPEQIEGYSRLGQIPIGRNFSIGLNQGGVTDDPSFQRSVSLRDRWSIRLDPANFNRTQR